MKTNAFSAVPLVQVRYCIPLVLAIDFNEWRDAQRPHILPYQLSSGPVTGHHELRFHVGYYAVDDAERIVAWLREHGVEHVEDLG